MGEAKRRGTFKKRLIQAVARHASVEQNARLSDIELDPNKRQYHVDKQAEFLIRRLKQQARNQVFGNELKGVVSEVDHGT